MNLTNHNISSTAAVTLLGSDTTISAIEKLNLQNRQMSRFLQDSAKLLNEYHNIVRQSRAQIAAIENVKEVFQNILNNLKKSLQVVVKYFKVLLEPYYSIICALVDLIIIFTTPPPYYEKKPKKIKFTISPNAPNLIWDFISN